jgi:hypothetical protein
MVGSMRDSRRSGIVNRFLALSAVARSLH